MRMTGTSEEMNCDRRRFVGAAAIVIAAAGASGALAAKARAATEGNAVRPFRVSVPEAELADLRRRVVATRWPDNAAWMLDPHDFAEAIVDIAEV
jgi:hypothetical protein